MLSEPLVALAILVCSIWGLVALILQHAQLKKHKKLHAELRKELEEHSAFLKQRAEAARSTSMAAEAEGNKAKEKRYLGEFLAFSDAHLDLDAILKGTTEKGVTCPSSTTPTGTSARAL